MEAKLEYPKGVFYAPAWKNKEEDVKKSLEGECKFCYIIENRIDKDIELLRFTYKGSVYYLFENRKPYFPGHLLLIPKLSKDYHPYDVRLFKKRHLDSILDLIRLLSDSDIWIGANFGYIAGQSIMHPHFHILPPPEKVSRIFFEEREIPDYIEEKTEEFLGYKNGFNVMKFVKGKKYFYGYYIKADELDTKEYLNLLSYLNSISLNLYGTKISYNLLLANKILYIVPRASFYEGKRIALLELFYNSELSRSLEGEDEERFWEVARKENKKILEKVLRLLNGEVENIELGR